MIDSFQDFINGRRQSKVMTNDRLCERVLRVIVAGNLSFSQAENPELRSLLAEGFPDCDLPSRRAIADRLKSEAKLARSTLKDRLAEVDSKVSLALDAWHSKVGNMEFLGMHPACNRIVIDQCHV